MKQLIEDKKSLLVAKRVLSMVGGGAAPVELYLYEDGAIGDFFLLLESSDHILIE